jgi:uncharacterized protein (TIGR03083 family)
VLSPADHLTALRSEGALLAAAVSSGPFDGRVPGIDDWTLDDVARHTGSVHEWICEVLRTGTLPDWGYDDLMPHAPQDHDTLPAWYLERLETLVELLGWVPTGQAVWTLFDEPTGVDFWKRRQCFETLVHRYDAEGAAGRRTPIDAELATDGVHEALQMVRHRTRFDHDREVRFAVRTTDTGRSWTLRLGGSVPRGERTLVDGSDGDVELSGRAADLVVHLWNRPPEQPVSLAGEASLWEVWQQHAVIR